MTKSVVGDGFVDHISQLLAPWTNVDARRMFGGVGMFAHGLMFAIIFDDDMYFKDTLDENGKSQKAPFKKEYFAYDRLGKTAYLRYFKAPEAALEDGSFLIELAKASYRSASLSKKPLKKKKLSKPPENIPRDLFI